MNNTWIIFVTSLGCVALYATIWAIFWKINRGPSYYFDAQDLIEYQNVGTRILPKSAQTGTFAPMLPHYLGVTKILITLSAASITFGDPKSLSKNIRSKVDFSLQHTVRRIVLRIFTLPIR